MPLSPERALRGLLGSFDQQVGERHLNAALRRAGEGSVLATIAMAATPKEQRFERLTQLFGDTKQARSIMAVAANIAARPDAVPTTAFQASVGLHLLSGELMRATKRMDRHPLAIAATQAADAVKAIREQHETTKVGAQAAVRTAQVATPQSREETEASRASASTSLMHQQERTALRRRLGLHPGARPVDPHPGTVRFVDQETGEVVIDYILVDEAAAKRARERNIANYMNAMATDTRSNYYVFFNMGEFASVARKVKAESGRDLRILPGGTIVVLRPGEVLSRYEERKGVLRIVTAARAEEIRLEVAAAKRRRQRRTSWWRVDVWVEKAAREIYDTGRDIVNAAGRLAQAIGRGDFSALLMALAGIGSIISDLVFGAMEVLLSWLPDGIGHQIVSAIRSIIETLMGMAVESARAMVLMLVGVGKFFAKLAQGDPVGAVQALFEGITRTLIAPTVYLIARSAGIAKEEVRGVIDRIVADNPMLPLDLLSLVIGGLTGAADQVVNKVVAIAKPLILSLLDHVAGATNDLRKAVDIGFTAVAFVVNRIGTIQEMAAMIAQKLKAPGGPGGVDLTRIVEQALDGAWDALKSFDLAAFFRSLGNMIERAGRGANWDAARRALAAPPVEALLRMTEQEMREQLARITPAQRAEFLRRLGEIQRGELPLLGPEALAQLMLRNPSVIERLPEIGPAIITAARQSPAALQQALTRLTSAQRDEIMRLVSQMRLPDPGEFMQRLAQMRLFDLEALVQQVLRNPNVIEQIPQVGPAIVAAARQGPPALQQALTRLAPAQLADFLRRLAEIQIADPAEFLRRLAQMTLPTLESLVRQVLRAPNVIGQIQGVGPAIIAAARQGPPALQRALARLAPAQLAEFLRRLSSVQLPDPEALLAQQALRDPRVVEQIPEVGPAMAAAARNGPAVIQRALDGDTVARDALEQVSQAAQDGDAAADAAWQVLRGLIRGNQRPAPAEVAQATTQPAKRLSAYQRGLMASMPGYA